ncbi:MAG: hypothetical protein NTU54_04200 [Candidatus Omnitrophica bacterium]|nr:hypothetical protein [Candidatus Omnitrophota bacterium]
MISINLLPDELKARSNKGIAPQDYAVYSAAGLLAALLALHLLLGLIYVVRDIHLGVLASAMKNQEPMLKKLENFKQEYGYLFRDELLPGQGGISWSEKLYCLSKDLPNGVWLNELSFVDRNFQLRGSIISLQRNEVGLMNAFTDSLKKDSSFFKDFVSLEPGALKRRMVAGYEVVDFSLQGTLRTR